MPFVPAEDGELQYEPMLGAKLLEARLVLGMKRLEFGHLLGMSGDNRNIYSTIKRYEDGQREISPMAERLVLMLLKHKLDFGYIPDLDSGAPKIPAEFTS